MANDMELSGTGASCPWTEPTRQDIAELNITLGGIPPDFTHPISLTQLGSFRVWLFWDIAGEPDPEKDDIVLATVFPAEAV